jgi:hypothetical protein
VSSFLGGAPGTSLFLPSPNVGDDPDEMHRYLLSLAQAIQTRDGEMLNLIGVLSRYADIEVVGIDGRAYICLGNPSGIRTVALGVNHEWKVTDSGAADDGGNNFVVAAGTVWNDDGASASLAETTIAISATETIYLEIHRESSSRALSASTPLVLNHAATVPSSSASVQNVPIAKIVATATSSGVVYDIIQLALDEIRVGEKMIVVNGALKLSSYALLARNFYDTP